MEDTAKTQVLEVSGLQVKLKTDAGAVSLLEPIHFELKKGRVLGLVGESGSGKTVTCNALLQLLDRQTMDVEGSVRLNGRELNGMPAEEMRRIRGKEIAFIMQNPMRAFTPVYTIGAQFMETIRTHTGLTKQQARDLAITALENMNLPNPAKLMKRYSFQLSGGMLQRVMIAISMCLRPAVVIADEPTTALDVVNQLQVLRELDRLRTEYDTSILLISHDLGVISQMADEVAVMQRGRIVEQAEVFQLFDQPQHEYTKMLLQARPKLSLQGRNQ
ncbi:nickel import ATP-binding protein NikD [Paenibacillus polymyxa]|uniref:nickel import ATP-binding protein NikD n=1 Tax=Paenibacillus polymyxa TaxID=1406 RepID=UPI001580667C|nr:nickel import ATP-binding protein NikD [Paenibacillus polymyxa]MBY0022036.1 nickel import ATP-binding protein NikD [Paenibacillus polymyxa]MBY0057879.1 nickel import ATP-binding protein NikD [Paenibacillus polymyxa]MBY0068492.1 nickel import ATP-binding protein NikD [Paenibacillus polymyxa]MBY0079059.1 nickel import ATP-binding protein NikD [Paenibacillus polymyxa]MBZ6443649.1 nickel import ATP-binding protein NikD [Paenibacillus polymyxa]